MFANYTPSIADIAAIGGGGNDGNGNGWNDGWWILIILFAIFGWGRGGFGNDGNGGGGSCCAPASCADLQRGFEAQATQQRFNGIDQGLCSTAYENAQLIATVNQNLNTGFAGIQNSMNQGFAGLNTGLMQQGYETRLATQGVQAQIAQCCCDEKQLIQQGITQGIMNTSAVQNQMQQCCCDAEKQAMQTRFDAQQDHCATMQAIDKLGDRIIDWLSADRAQALRDENQWLKFQTSQADQNQYLRDQLRPCPTPAYITCNPWANQAPYGSCCQPQGCC